MSIKHRYHEKKSDVLDNPTGPVATEIKSKAEDAIYAGVYSADWVALLALFVESPAELARFSGTDGTVDPVRRHAIAHIVANALIGLDKAPDIDYLLDALDADSN